jgi:hypothetical protein
MRAAAELPTMRRSALRLALLTMFAGLPWQSARAQRDSTREEDAGARWQLSELRKSFCVQWLLNPDSLRIALPRGARLLPAEKNPDLHPALRRVVENQPEYRSWTPSALCFYRMGRVQAESRVVQGGADSARVPVLGIWTVAAETGGTGPRHLALELRANDGDLRDAGQAAGLELDRLNVSVGPVPSEDGPRPDETRYEIRFGKTLLVWDGRSSPDTTRRSTPIAWSWQAVRRKGGWLTGALTLAPAASSMMVGSLRVEGRDPLARALQGSPIRYVGPAYQGGEGQLQVQ